MSNIPEISWLPKILNSGFVSGMRGLLVFSFGAIVGQLAKMSNQ
jgi:hypothetical protein